MKTTNVAAVLHGVEDLRLEPCKVPEPDHGQVQLEMRSVGICGSDVSYYAKGKIGDFVLNNPMILGHEASGVVTKVGEGVSSFSVGDRVAIEPGVPCRICQDCKIGRYNLCTKVKFCATPPYDGSLTNYYVHDADFCYKLPDHVSFDEAALLEPISVAVHACKRAGVQLGTDCFITGMGTIGLVNLLVAKASGAGRVVACDIDEHRRAVAKDFGADIVLNPKDFENEKDLAAAAESALGSKPACSIECTGVEQCMKAAIHLTRSGGCVVMVGMGKADLTLPILEAAIREIDIRGVFRYVNCYPTALAMVASGRVDVKKLITHRFPLSDAEGAVLAAKDMIGKPIKIIIDCGPVQQ